MQLRRMLGQIQKQAQYQNAFFASASHELRTPLRIMLTELQTLQNDQTPQTIKPVIKNQIAEVQRLNKLVNDFLLLSQLKSGTLTLNKTVIHLPEITLKLLESFKTRAEENAQTFKIELLPVDGEFDIYSDRSQLVTMLLNLFENTVKHGQPDSTVCIKIEKRTDKIVLTIQNRSKTKIENPSRLMQEFSRKDLSSDGFGLGLWIAARLAETIGAKFEVHFDEPYFIARITFSKA